MYNEAVEVKMTMLADVADIGNSRKTVRVVFHVLNPTWPRPGAKREFCLTYVAANKRKR